MPAIARSLVRKHVTRKSRRPQHVNVMHLAEQILHVFEIAAPGFMLDRQEIFHDIAKALNPNAQRVERHLGLVPQRGHVQIASGRPALQCEMFEYGAPGRIRAARAGRESHHSFHCLRSNSPSAPRASRFCSVSRAIRMCSSVLAATSCGSSTESVTAGAAVELLELAAASAMGDGSTSSLGMSSFFNPLHHDLDVA